MGSGLTTGKTYKEKIVQALNKLADIIDPDGDTNDNILFKDSSDDVIAGSLERIADNYEAGGSGGGGGGGVMLIAATYNDEPEGITLDKTWKEIDTAIKAGVVCVIHYTDEVDGALYAEEEFIKYTVHSPEGNGFPEMFGVENSSGIHYYTLSENGYPSTNAGISGGSDDSGK